MTNLLYSLPTNIIQNIYEYDNTYRKIYDLLLCELLIRYKQAENLENLLRRHSLFLKIFHDFVESERESI